MSNANIIAAIVLGSSKVTGIVGNKEIDGSIRVKAHVAIQSSDFIGKGRVLNVEKMASCLSNIKAHLEEQSGYRIKCFYAAIDCQGLRSNLNEVAIQFPSSEIVTDEMLSSISVRNREGNPADREILEAIPVEYRLGAAGTHTVTEPKGVQTERLQAKYLNVTCNSHVVTTIQTCFRKAGIEIAGGHLVIAAEQLASIITNEQERTSGCAFVDMGSETTTVAIYKNKFLRHFIVIPLGSANITRDIVNVFNVEHDEAENFKRTYGYPDMEEIDEKEEIHLRDGGRVKKLSELADIIDARVEEIVQNIKHQIEITGYTNETLVNGLYICGGGAQMNNIHAAFASHFKEWNVRIIKNSTRLKVVSSEPKFNETGIYNTGLAIIDNGDINCYGGEYQGLFETEPAVEEPAPAETKPDTPAAEAAADEKPDTTPEPAEEPKEEKPKKPKGPSAFGRFLKSVGEWGKNLVSED